MNLYTPEQIERARQHVARDENAKKIADGIFTSAAPWLERDDTLLHELMPDANVPRTWTVNYVTGCPVHGSGPEGYGGYAQGGWKYDPFKDKWKITCGIGGETYPSNDFEAFYQSGMQDRSLLTGPYADDGWGWQGPDSPFRHWFVAYCCENIWSTVMGGLGVLSRAYLLSGDAAYAHKALVILNRIAEVYPDMDYSKQSMYALEFSPGYDGKMHNLISETGTVRRLCEALDAVRDAIPQDPTFGANAETVRAKLDSGIIGAGLEGVYTGHVRGNYGMHQEALMCAALASGDQKVIDRAVDWVMDNTGEATTLKEMQSAFDGYVFRDKSAHAEGINFALDNLIFREGIGWESSPSYNNGWVVHLTNIAHMLERAGVRLWDRPKFRRMYRWAEEMTATKGFTPAIGDAGNATGGHVAIGAGALRTAYRAIRDPFVGELLRRHKSTFDSFESLLEEPLDVQPEKTGADEVKQLTGSSHLMGGYGLALLRSGRAKSQVAASVDYGRGATEHAHFDRLNLELFAQGKKLVPDMGYPEHAAEGDRPGVWTKNTLSHATVVVDGRRQDTQGPGRLHHFVSADGLSLVEVDAPDTYHSTSEYRRTVALVDIGPDTHYVIDLFRVSGGSQHDYSIHGFDAPFSANGIDLSAPQEKGTLAGPDIPKGAIYDDDGLTDPLRKGRSYYTYRGGGYSYLYDVQRGKPSGSWTANWQEEKTGIGLHATFLSSDEAIVSHGDPPRKPGNPKQLTYVLLRNAGNGITSQFASVLEPYRETPQIQSVQQVERTAESISLKIRHAGGEDTVRHIVGPQGSSFSMVRRDSEGNLVKLHQIGKETLHAGGQSLAIEKPITGRVVSVDPDAATVEIERDRDSQPFRASGLRGEVARFGNSRRSAAYNIDSVEGKGRQFRIGFGTDSFRIGRFVITGVNADGSVISTKTNLYMASQGYYRGCWLTDEHHAVWIPVDDVLLTPHQPGLRRDGQIRLTEPGATDDRFKPGRIAYLYDFGPGDTFNITPHATAAPKTDGSFRTRGNGRADLSTT